MLTRSPCFFQSTDTDLGAQLLRSFVLLFRLWESLHTSHLRPSKFILVPRGRKPAHDLMTLLLDHSLSSSFNHHLLLPLPSLSRHAFHHQQQQQQCSISIHRQDSAGSGSEPTFPLFSSSSPHLASLGAQARLLQDPPLPLPLPPRPFPLEGRRKPLRWILDQDWSLRSSRLGWIRANLPLPRQRLLRRRNDFSPLRLWGLGSWSSRHLDLVLLGSEEVPTARNNQESSVRGEGRATRRGVGSSVVPFLFIPRFFFMFVPT